MSPLTLDGQDPAVFARGVSELRRFNSSQPRLLAPNFGVAIAVLLHRLAPGKPALGPPTLLSRARTGSPISTRDLQTQVCDPTWEKAAAVLPNGATGPIYKPFTDNFKGRSPATNNWRNSFDLQAGLGCDAPSQLLADSSYVGEPRFDCRFRDPSTGECWSPAGNVYAATRTCFNPNKRDVPPGPDTNALPRPKLLGRGIDTDGNQGYWFVEPTVDVLADLLAAPGKRVPVYAFAAALYGGSPYFAQWSAEVSRERLERDLALGSAEFITLFDTDASSFHNANTLRGLASEMPSSSLPPAPPVGPRAGRRPPVLPPGTGPAGTTSPVGGYSVTPLSDPVQYKERGTEELKTRAGAQADPARRKRLLERANEGHRRTLGHVAEQLQAAGYAVDEQLDGYDLCARRAGEAAHLFEVKTWTADNLASQVRGGWAQLHEYRYRNRDRLPSDVCLYLVLDREPPPDFWAWKYLAEEEGVLPCWISGGVLHTLAQYSDRLPWSG